MSNGFCKNRGYVVFYCYISSNSVLFLMFWTFVAFNTSHVKVNLTNNIIKQHNPVSFNTSHVKVNLKIQFIQNRSSKVSIHPMLKLINKGCISTLIFIRFNTSHVKVNRRWAGRTAGTSQSFQYIPC